MADDIAGPPEPNERLPGKSHFVWQSIRVRCNAGIGQGVIHFGDGDSAAILTVQGFGWDKVHINGCMFESDPSLPLGTIVISPL